MSIIADSIREVGFIHNLCDEAADEIERLEEELASYKLDAERYRWLRHGDNDELCMGKYTYAAGDCRIIEKYLLRNEQLDEKIDKHIQIDKEYYERLGVQYD